MKAVLSRFLSFNAQQIVIFLLIGMSVFSVSIMSLSQHAYAHVTVDSGATVKTLDNKYQIAFQLYPKFVSAGQDSTLHFTILDENKSNLIGVYSAMVMKEKDTGNLVEQMPYKFYETSDISIPYKFHENSNYVATLMIRINGDPKYVTTPLQADFDIPVRQTTTMSPNELLLMVVPFTAALGGGIMFLFKKKKMTKLVNL